MVTAAHATSEFPPGIQDQLKTLVELLQWRAQHQPDQLAYRFLEHGEIEAGSLTFGQLDRRVRAVAAQLQQQVRQGERALMLYPSGLDFIVAFLACLYAGIIAVPAYPPRRNQNVQRIQAILGNCQAKIILTIASQQQEILARLAETNTCAALPSLATDGVDPVLAEQWQPVPVTPQTLAFLQYTSGSTGTPKGVMVTHQNLWTNQQMIREGFAHSDQTVFVGWLPLFHDMGLVGNVLQPLFLGTPCTLMSPVSFLQRPFRWLQAISHYRATTSGGPNFAYDLCVERATPEKIKDLDLSSWQVAFNGAEPVWADTLRRFAETFAPCGFRWQAFYPCYGMAETTLFVTGGPPQEAPVLQSFQAAGLEQNQVMAVAIPHPGTRELVGCGQIWLEEDLRIVNPETLQLCAPEEVGEIWVAGDHVAAGYWERPEATLPTFQAQPQGYAEQPFLRTGDLGFLWQGQLFITGRLKDVVIIRGQNHYPQDIERTVQHSHPTLRSNSGAAFTVQETGQGEQLVIVQEVERTALRQLQGETDQIVEAIRTAVSQEYELQVVAIRLIKPFSLPKTSSGKVRRSACRQAYLEGTLQEVASWQRSTPAPDLDNQVETVAIQSAATPASAKTQKQIQAWLVNYLARSLQVNSNDIDPGKAFATYGLDSAVAVSMTTDLGDWLELDLEVMLLWEYPTIASVSEYLASACRSLSGQ
ncbi:MAG: AMP-binding protein [Synechococcaceae cyanobacterium SM2_3_1]|nr:AMP-binding protein [Synechococcaceae cyanobacterium SM2_3_1]